MRVWRLEPAQICIVRNAMWNQKVYIPMMFKLLSKIGGYKMCADWDDSDEDDGEFGGDE